MQIYAEENKKREIALPKKQGYIKMEAKYAALHFFCVVWCCHSDSLFKRPNQNIPCGIPIS